MLKVCQLTAKEDAYIHVNPQISFYECLRRYSNFSKITFEVW